MVGTSNESVPEMAIDIMFVLINSYIYKNDDTTK